MEPQEILVRGPNWTGDVIMATPGFRALRAGFPAARITLQLRESQLPLLAGAPWFDERLPVRSYGRRGLAPLREGLALRAQRRFDLGVCLPDSFSSALLMRAAVRGQRGRATGAAGAACSSTVRCRSPRRRTACAAGRCCRASCTCSASSRRSAARRRAPSSSCS